MNTVRKVDTFTYIGALRELIDEGKEVSVVISGNSMTPFLVDGRDRILISPVRQPLKKGDMAFYQRRSGHYVMHRICSVKNGREYYLIGDAQNTVEGPVDRDQIFGVITAVCRKGKWIRRGDWCWEFFCRVWINVIPLRRVLWKGYRMTVGKVKHRHR